MATGKVGSFLGKAKGLQNVGPPALSGLEVTLHFLGGLALFLHRVALRSAGQTTVEKGIEPFYLAGAMEEGEHERSLGQFTA